MTTLPDKPLALRVIPMPADSNANGDIFGGWIMSQVDLAGSIPAVRRAKGRIATVAVNSFVFKQPVQIGDVVSFYATIKRVVAPQSRLTLRCSPNAIAGPRWCASPRRN